MGPGGGGTSISKHTSTSRLALAASLIAVGLAASTPARADGLDWFGSNNSHHHSQLRHDIRSDEHRDALMDQHIGALDGRIDQLQHRDRQLDRASARELRQGDTGAAKYYAREDAQVDRRIGADEARLDRKEGREYALGNHIDRLQDQLHAKEDGHQSHTGFGDLFDW